MEELMDGKASAVQVGALLAMMRVRGETPEELAAFARVMRSRAVPVEAPPGAVDLCGTGADGLHTFNISTLASFVVAGAGVPVAKHGNRAITSAAGSADVLEALGVRTDHDATSAGEALHRHGFAFLFAPGFHPAMKHAGPTRREIGVRTAFNLLGPITNPAGARRQVVGVADPDAAPRLAEVLRLLGVDRAFVVHGTGLDELPLDGTGVLYDVTPDGIERLRIDARSFGLPVAPLAALAGGDAAANARLSEAVLRGESGARRDVVLLNAGAALMAAGRVETIDAGIELGALTIDAGLTAELLEALRAEKRAADAARAPEGAPA
jgi:anthranilate phosphoribosyltransferase